MSGPRHLSLLGGPFSGKSTYLGALVDALQTERIDHLRMGDLPSDAHGLMRLPEPLQEGRFPPRTSANQRLRLVAPLRTHGSFFQEESFTLDIGDYDGEEVERLFRDRITGWSDEWRQRAKARGLLLLVRPALTSPPPRVQGAPPNDSERWNRLRGVQAPYSQRPEPVPAVLIRPEHVFESLSLGPLSSPPPAAPTDSVTIPAALDIIELLQFIRHVRELAPGERPRGERSFPIALLFSAWDSMDRAWKVAGPERYLSEHLPLLADYLWSNFHQDDFFCFGLSATGGDLSDPAYSKRYQADPSGFVSWHSPQGMRQTRDIGLPLYWLLFGDRAFGTVD